MKVKTDTPVRTQWFVVVSASFALMYFIFNCRSGYTIDDFTYRFIFERWRISDNPILITSARDIIPSMVTHYLVWSGRAPVHTVAQWLLLYDKMFFNVLNSLIIALLGLLVYLHINLGKKRRFLLYLAIHAMLWFFLPAPDHTILFLTGAVNYLWTAVFVLLFLLPFRVFFETRVEFRHTKTWIAAIIPFGFFAGWSNEPSAVGAFVIIFLFSSLLLKEGQKLPPWFFSGFASLCAGFCVMFFAPGYRQKADDLYAAENIILYAVRNFSEIAERVLGRTASSLWPVFLIIALLFYALLKIREENKGKRKPSAVSKTHPGQSDSVGLSVIYMLAGSVGILMYFGSPEFEHRYLFSPAVFFILAAGVLFCRVYGEFSLRKTTQQTLFLVLTTLLSVCVFANFFYELRILSFNYDVQMSIENEIQRQVSVGQKDVLLTEEYAFIARGRYSLYHGANFSFGSLWGTNDSDAEINRLLAAYFGADTLTIEKDMKFIDSFPK